MKFSPAKLFHAVVISGAALTGQAGMTCAPNVAPESNAISEPADAVNAASSPGTCPPGSERPFPPCYWIK